MAHRQRREQDAEHGAPRWPAAPGQHRPGQLGVGEQRGHFQQDAHQQQGDPDVGQQVQRLAGAGYLGQHQILDDEQHAGDHHGAPNVLHLRILTRQPEDREAGPPRRTEGM